MTHFRHKWTEPEDAKLLELRKAGKSWWAIARDTHMGQAQVQGRHVFLTTGKVWKGKSYVQKHRAESGELKLMRPCLGPTCGHKSFLTVKAQRLCKNCLAAVARIHAGTI